MIRFQLEQVSGLPPYLQLIRQVRHALRLGRWLTAARTAGLDDECIEALVSATMQTPERNGAEHADHVPP